MFLLRCSGVLDLRHKQFVGVCAALPAMLAVYLVYRYAQPLFARVALPADDGAERLQFAARWLLLPGLTLLVGIVAAARRGFFADAIDGTRTPANRGLEINLRYNQNTLEQTVLCAIAWLGLSLQLPRDDLWMIAAMGWLFLIGRATFWIGYLLHPIGRAFGMTLTVVPTLLAYAWLASRQWGG